MRMAAVYVTCRLGAVDVDACREHMVNNDLNFRDISVQEEENEPDAFRWIFETSNTTLDALR